MKYQRYNILFPTEFNLPLTKSNKEAIKKQIYRLKSEYWTAPDYIPVEETKELQQLVATTKPRQWDDALLFRLHQYYVAAWKRRHLVSGSNYEVRTEVEEKVYTKIDSYYRENPTAWNNFCRRKKIEGSI